MKKYYILGAIILTAIIIAISQHKSLFSSATCPTPALNYYTAYPPFITSGSALPNVMLVLDTSGSMFNTAYADGWRSTITNTCTASGAPCTDFTVGGTWVYPTNKYYGYFDPNYWYTYSSNRFSRTAPKTGSGLTGARVKTSSEWDGNFLNWLTMRRVDVTRKVLTGGNSIGSGSSTRLLGAKVDCNGRGKWFNIASPGNYTPYSTVTYFGINTNAGSCDGSGSGTSTFTVYTTGNPSFNVDVVVGAAQQGVLQNMWTSVRWGISVYNINAPTPAGGKVTRQCGGTATRGDFVNDINNKRPDSNTPLAETLWTNVGYFAQTTSWTGIGGPGPRYNSGDYTVNNNWDPYNYGTGGQPIYVSCAKSFILYVTDGEPCADGDLPASLSDYAGGAGSSYNCTASSCLAVGSFSAQTLPSCSATGNVAGIEDVALFMHTNDIRTSVTKDITDTQVMTLYSVFAFAGADSTLLQYASINGAFTDSNSNNLPDLQSEWDENSDGVPDTYFKASDGYALESALLTALNDILKRASSGSAASVLATTQEGAGAVYQAYLIAGTPGSTATEANWRGYVQGLFMDKYGNLREDNANHSSTLVQLDYGTPPTCVGADNIVQMVYDTTVTPNRTRVKRYNDSDCDGKPDSLPFDTKELSDITPLWEGGKILWQNTSASRKIFTTINGSSFTGLSSDAVKGTFYDSNKSALRPYLRASTDTEAANIINFIRGDSISGYRKNIYPTGGANTWKLGDIVYSSPTLVPHPMENFHLLYADKTYKAFFDLYKEGGTKDRRHVLYAGANDGMLHAFNAGKFSSGPPQTFTGDGYDLGRELWTFIPRDLLPHLKWLTDPGYTHVYYVDLEPKITDARIFDVDADHPYGWGTILIGGMRFGGKNICVEDDFGSGIEERNFKSSYFALDITDPVNPRLLWTFTDDDLGLTTSYPAVVRVGPKDSTVSSGTWFVVLGSGPTDYDATSDQQGKIFTLKMSGAANGVINSWTAGTNYWESGVDFLTSGPTIDNYAFMANPTSIDVGLDYDVDVMYIGNTYCDNPISALSPEACSSSNWKGKMYRIATKPNKLTDPSSNPALWKLSILFDPTVAQATDPNIRNGAISAAPTAAMDDRGNLFVYYGTGRFWHTNDRALDCPGGICESWNFVGIKDLCKPWFDPDNAACASSITDLYNSTSVDVCGKDSVGNQEGGDYTTCGSLYGTPDYWWQTGGIIDDARAKNGWYLNFPPPTEDDGERVLHKAAVIGGLVIWTTYTPSPNDPCAYEGSSRLYAAYYTTGTAYQKYVFDQPQGAVLRHYDLGVGVPSAVGIAVVGDKSIMSFVVPSTGTIFQKAAETAYGLRSGPTGWKSEGCQ